METFWTEKLTDLTAFMITQSRDPSDLPFYNALTVTEVEKICWTTTYFYARHFLEADTLGTPTE